MKIFKSNRTLVYIRSPCRWEKDKPRILNISSWKETPSSRRLHNRSRSEYSRSPARLFPQPHSITSIISFKFRTFLILYKLFLIITIRCKYHPFRYLFTHLVMSELNLPANRQLNFNKNICISFCQLLHRNRRWRHGLHVSP